jgi:hypothetical protein
MGRRVHVSAVLAALLSIFAFMMPTEVAAQQVTGAVVVSSCGTPPTTYAAGSAHAVLQDTTGVLCTSSSGGGGGAVTIADNADVTQGAKADSACATDTGTCSLIALAKRGNQNMSGPISAGTNIIGKVGVDQTTPGTTNNVTVSTNVGTLPLVQATASAAISTTAAGGPTQLIAASGSTKIYVTHYDLVLSGAGTFAWVTGTGTNCGTGTAYLTGASSHPMSFAANGGISAGGGLGPILITGAGGELCYITTGAVDISGSVSYAQF